MSNEDLPEDLREELGGGGTRMQQAADEYDLTAFQDRLHDELDAIATGDKDDTVAFRDAKIAATLRALSEDEMIDDVVEQLAEQRGKPAPKQSTKSDVLGYAVQFALAEVDEDLARAVGHVVAERQSF